MSYILGIDEAGRGAWAGPLVVGAVILGGSELNGLTDSKLLSREQRTELAKLIESKALAFGIGWVSSKEIDKLGLTSATTLGIERAIEGLDDEGSEIIIDGHINYLPNHMNSRCVIKADLSIPAVSAASIIAKVTRDNHMARLGQDFPAYGFANHVGYGTKRHLNSIVEFGLLDVHRKSFKPVSKFA